LKIVDSISRRIKMLHTSVASAIPLAAMDEYQVSYRFADSNSSLGDHSQ